MTYKSTGDSKDWIERSGSHATRPSATGRIDDLPSWAKEPEEYFNSINQQWQSIKQQTEKTKKELSDVNFRLKQTLAFADYERLACKRDDLADRVNELQQRSHDYRELVRAAAQNAYGTVFFYVAEKVLDLETVWKIQEQTREILGRGFSAGIDAPRPPGYNKRKHRKDKLQDRRERFRDQRDPHRLVMVHKED